MSRLYAKTACLHNARSHATLIAIPPEGYGVAASKPAEAVSGIVMVSFVTVDTEIEFVADTGAFDVGIAEVVWCGTGSGVVALLLRNIVVVVDATVQVLAEVEVEEL